MAIHAGIATHLSIDMDINCDHIEFQYETSLIDNFIHLLHCAPQYFIENEHVINLMVDKTVEFLIIMFDTFHKHTTRLKRYVLQHKQSRNQNDYSNIKKICKTIQELENESYRIRTISLNTLKFFQKASDVFEVLNGRKPKSMVGHVQETKLNTNVRVLLHLLDYKDKNPNNAEFTDILEDPQVYIEQQRKILEDQKKKAREDLASHIKEIKSNTNEQITSINQRSRADHSTLVKEWVMKDKAFDKRKSKVKQNLSQKLRLYKCYLETDLKEKAKVCQQKIDECKVHHEKDDSKILQLNKQREEGENELRASYHQKCKKAREIADDLLCDIERDKSAEYRKVKEGIEISDETVTNESNDSTREAYKTNNKFEEELKKKEEAIITETNYKRLHLQNLFQSMKVQLEYVEHRKQQQIQLIKVLSISFRYVGCAIQNIESYLYTTEFFWNDEIISACSKLMKNTVARNFAKLRNAKKIIEIKKLEIDQKSTTFKISVKHFFAECSAFVDACCLTDEKMITARENILKLSTYTKQNVAHN